MRCHYAGLATGIAFILYGSMAAADQHIACNFTGSSCLICDRSDDSSNERALSFFLDDANEQLVPEGASVASAHTNSYSETEVKADIEINSLPIARKTQITVMRTKGIAMISASLVPSGVDLETGECHEVAVRPAQ
jgi:hypothetical protein